MNLDTQREESQTEMRDSSSAAQASQETTSGWKKEGRPPGSLWPEWDPQGIFTVLLWPLQLTPPVTREPGRAPPRHAHGDLTSLAPHGLASLAPRKLRRCPTLRSKGHR